MNNKVLIDCIGYVENDIAKAIEIDFEKAKGELTVSRNEYLKDHIKTFMSFSDACCFFKDMDFQRDDLIFDNENQQYWMNDGEWTVVNDVTQQKGSIKLTCCISDDYEEFYFFYCETNEPVDDILIESYSFEGIK